MKKQFTKIFISISLAIISLAFAQQEITTVAELERLAPLGGEYRLAAGTYELSKPLLLTKGLSLLGAGIGKTIVTGSSPKYLVMIDSKDQFNFAGISFKYLGSEGSDIFQIVDASYDISKCSFFGAVFGEQDGERLGQAIFAYGDSKGSISRSAFKNNALSAIVLGGDAELKLSNSRIDHNGSAIVIFNNASAIVEKSKISDNGSSGNSAIIATDDSSLVLKDNKIVDNLAESLFILGNAKVRAIKNLVKNNGIADKASPGSMQSMSTVSNPSDPKQYKAILASGNTELDFSENVFEGNNAGVLSLSESAEAKFSNNIFSKNGNPEGRTILARDNAKLTLDKNKFNINYGLSFGDKSVIIISDNLIDTNLDETKSAIDVRGDVDATITGNTIQQTEDNLTYHVGLKTAGIGIFGNAKAIISANTISSKAVGIQVGSNASVKTEQNEIKNNTIVGVVYFGNATGLIANNTISDNKEGIVVTAEATPTIQENSFNNNDNDINDQR